MTGLRVVPDEPWDERKLLEHVQSLDPKDVSGTVLAALSGLHRSKVNHKLRKWRKEGLIGTKERAKPDAKKRGGKPTRKPPGNDNRGDNVIRFATEAELRAGGLLADFEDVGLGVEGDDEPANDNLIDAAKIVPAMPPAVELPKPMTAVDVPTPRPRMTLKQALCVPVLALIGGGLGAIGLVLNINFAGTLSASEWRILFQGLGALADLATMFSLVAAGLLWEHKKRALAVTFLGLWPFFVAFTLLASCGFAASNIGDAVQMRKEVIDKRAVLETKLDSLRTERAAITERRSPKEIEEEIIRDRPFVGRDILRSSADCTYITLTSSRIACQTITDLRVTQKQAERRDALDAQIDAVDKERQSLAPIAADDPGARMAVKMLGGLVSLEQVQTARIAMLTIAPALSAVFLWGAVSLWGAPGRRRTTV